MILGLVVAPTQKSHAIIWVVVKAAVKKAIQAADLVIQREQNKVIWLQNAQKALENTMSKLKLDEISDWTERQRTLYKDYFDELSKVKSLIALYKDVKDIGQKQLRLVSEYKRAWQLIQNDKNFTAGELDYIAKVYSGILSETVKNIDALSLAINAFQTQMTDEKRMEIVRKVSESVDQNYFDLRSFNQESYLLSIQRSKSQQDIDQVKKYYGLN